MLMVQCMWYHLMHQWIRTGWHYSVATNCRVDPSNIKVIHDHCTISIGIPLVLVILCVGNIYLARSTCFCSKEAKMPGTYCLRSTSWEETTRPHHPKENTRCHAGTLALRKIHFYQKQTNLLLLKMPFSSWVCPTSKAREFCKTFSTFTFDMLALNSFIFFFFFLQTHLGNCSDIQIWPSLPKGGT